MKDQNTKVFTVVVEDQYVTGGVLLLNDFDKNHVSPTDRATSYSLHYMLEYTLKFKSNLEIVSFYPSGATVEAGSVSTFSIPFSTSAIEDTSSNLFE